MGDQPTEEIEELDEAFEGEHRGAFGEFGGESSGFIDRAFRERIVLASVTLSGDNIEEAEASLDELAHGRGRSGGSGTAQPFIPRPGNLCGQR